MELERKEVGNSQLGKFELTGSNGECFVVA